MVHDAVESQLNQEVDVIQACQEKMKRLIARAEQQLQSVFYYKGVKVIFI